MISYRKQRGVGVLVCALLGTGMLNGGNAFPVAVVQSHPADQIADARDGSVVIHLDGRDLQKVIDEAPPSCVIRCDPNQQIVLSTPIQIRKPLTLSGLNARLPEKLGKTSLVIVTAKGVTICDFVLTGNGESVSQDDRAPLVAIGAGDFRVERGRFLNSSKDGVMIDGDVGDGKDIVGGVVRDIVGQDVIRDTVSISGSGGGQVGGHIRNILVDNIRCYHSSRRGCVEVSDGSDNITVRKVYAEASLYAIDVQDHGQRSQVNRNVLIEDVYAWRCKHAIRTSNIALGHANLTVRDITAKECTVPIQISNTTNLNLSDVRILDHGEIDLETIGVLGKKTVSYPVHIKNCNGVSVRDVVIENSDLRGPAMLIEDCNRTLVDGLDLKGNVRNLTMGVCYRLTVADVFDGLRINNVVAPGVLLAGIMLEAGGRNQHTLSNYIISGNVARVQDGIQGKGAIIVNNLP
jgi:hypothetical protein